MVLKIRSKNHQEIHEKLLTSLAIRQRQIKAMLRFHPSPVQMAVIKKTRVLAKVQRKGTRTPLVGTWTRAPSVETSVEGQTPTVEMPYDPATAFPGIQLQESNHRDARMPVLTTSPSQQPSQRDHQELHG